MNLFLKNTKIIATSGPSITKQLSNFDDLKIANSNLHLEEVKSIFEKIFYYGTTCVRFNFSHSNNAEREFRIFLIKESQKLFAEKGKNRLKKFNNSDLKFFKYISKMCDTKGPEIRVYDLESDCGVKYSIGNIVEIHSINKVIGNKNKFSIVDSTATYNMANDCVVGNKILADDGKLSMKILKSDKKTGIITVKIENTHTLKKNKRINLPNAIYSMPFLSENDKNDIIFSLKNEFEIIALSFVNKKEDILSVKKIVEKYKKSNVAIFSKIETKQALNNIDEIINNSDGIMIARGDLGLDIPYYEVPFWTKVIVKKCAQKNIPVIVATQMLDSLESNIIPTRAEVTDVYRAIELGVDATMLSGETAQGMFPVIAVKTMRSIASESEKNLNFEKFFNFWKKRKDISNFKQITDIIYKIYDLIKENNNSVIGITCFSSDIDHNFIKIFSSAKFQIPLTIFESVSSVDDKININKLNHHTLFWGINFVAVINLQLNNIFDCFKNYLYSFIKKPMSYCPGKKIIIISKNTVKLETI